MTNPRRLILSAIVWTVLADPAGAQTFTVTLTGAAEVGAGAPGGSGLAAITLNGTTVGYAISVHDIAPPIAAHIHKAAVGVSGPVVIGFNPVFTNEVASGSVTASASDVADIAAHPEAYYVNVHTADFPAGAIRGQLDTGPPHSVTFGTTLTGAGEAPANGSATGGGLATVTIAGTSVSFSLLVNGIAPVTAAHIHRGVAGSSGPVLVGFNPVFSGGVASGTVTTTEALAREIVAHPSNFYVNVHNADFPGGALRGQLDPAPPPAVYLPTVAKADGQNGTKFVSDMRIVNLSGLNMNVTADFYAANPAGLTAPTATFSFPVAPNRQAVFDDVLNTLFNLSGSGALRITTDQAAVVRSRVLNDLRSAGNGTTGVLVPGLTLKDARTGATLPLLSNASASDTAEGKGFRTNLGYFNPGSSPAKITFTAKRNDGTTIGTAVITAPALARVQQSVFTLIPVSPSDQEQANFYITYTSDLPVFVYAVSVDNKTGDGTYIDAASAP